MIPAASSPSSRVSDWNATKAGDFRFDISLMAMVIGLWPGFRFTTATFSQSEPRSMLETADSDLTRNNDSRDKNIPNLNFVRNGENRRRFLTQAELTREWPEVESTREMAYEKRKRGEI